MQKVKTLFIFTFMVVILYGAYLVLYKGPAPTPKEVEEHLANGGADPLELNLGEQISADELLAGITDQLPLDEGRDDITAADNGEFISPAADALGGQNDLPETADVSGLKLPTQPVAESSALQDNPITPTTETGSDANTNLDDRGGSFQIISPAGSVSATVSDDGSDQPAGNASDTVFPVTDDSAAGNLHAPDFSDGQNIQAPTQNPQTNQTPIFTKAWLTAQQQIETGHLREALLALSVYYRSPELSVAQHQQLLPVLDYLAGEVVYSRKHYMAPAYTVGINETVDSIAHQHRIPARLLANINGLRSTDTVQPGDEIKVMRGPFRGAISLSKKELTLFVGHLYAGRFSIETGSQFPAAIGLYTILDKQTDRSFSSADGSVIPGGHGSNPFGHYWMDLGGNISIHGSAANAQLRQAGWGSIGLSPVDARDVYSILSAGSQVVIQR